MENQESSVPDMNQYTFKFECNYCGTEYACVSAEDNMRPCPKCGQENESYDSTPYSTPVDRKGVPDVVSVPGVGKVSSQAIADAQRLLDGARREAENGAKAFLKMGMYFSLLSEGKKYRYLGYKTLDDVFKDNGVDRTTGNDSIAVYRKLHPYLEKLEHVNIAPKRLTNIVRALNKIPEDKVDEVLRQAADIPEYSAFADELRGHRGEKRQIDCDHAEQELWVKCTKCNKFFPYKKD